MIEALLIKQDSKSDFPDTNNLQLEEKPGCIGNPNGNPTVAIPSAQMSTAAVYGLFVNISGAIIGLLHCLEQPRSQRADDV